MSEKGVRKASVGQAPLVRLVAEMNAAGNDSRLELYGQSHHAFDVRQSRRRDRPQGAPRPFARRCGPLAPFDH